MNFDARRMAIRRMIVVVNVLQQAALPCPVWQPCLLIELVDMQLNARPRPERISSRMGMRCTPGVAQQRERLSLFTCNRAVRVQHAAQTSVSTAQCRCAAQRKVGRPVVH